VSLVVSGAILLAGARFAPQFDQDRTSAEDKVQHP
jgi:hypothetical protein